MANRPPAPKKNKPGQPKKKPAARQKKAAPTPGTVAVRIAANKEVFLEALGMVGIVSDACRLTDTSRTTVYEWRKGDEAFAEKWMEMVKQALHERLIEASYDPKAPAVLIFAAKSILGLSDGAGEIDVLRKQLEDSRREVERMRLVVFRACKDDPSLKKRISDEIAGFDRDKTKVN